MRDPFFSVRRGAQTHVTGEKLCSHPFPLLEPRLLFLKSRKFWISWALSFTAGKPFSWLSHDPFLSFSNKLVAEVWAQILPFLFPGTVWFMCLNPWTPPTVEHLFPTTTDLLPKPFGEQPRLAASHACHFGPASPLLPIPSRA